MYWSLFGDNFISIFYNNLKDLYNGIICALIPDQSSWFVQRRTNIRDLKSATYSCHGSQSGCNNKELLSEDML
jgi:hypothetical protein